jgi:hypothetical protein
MILPYLDQAPLYNRFNFSVPAVDQAPMLGFNAAAVTQNLSVIVTPLAVHSCPSNPGGITTYQGLIPKGSVKAGLPPFDITYTLASGDYASMSAVFRNYASIAFATFGTGGILEGTMLFESKVRFADITDGASNTILSFERTGGAVIYQKGVAVTAFPYNLYGQANGGGWADLAGGENWISGALYDGTQPQQGGPCAVNCTNIHGAGLYAFHVGGAHVVLADGSVRFIGQNISQFTLASLITRTHGEPIGNF